MKTLLERPIECDRTDLWINATCVMVRTAGRIVSINVVIAVGVNSDRRREVLVMDVDPSEDEIFWIAFLRESRAGGCAS